MNEIQLIKSSKKYVDVPSYDKSPGIHKFWGNFESVLLNFGLINTKFGDFVKSLMCSF